jgi:hypothetical protein
MARPSNPVRTEAEEFIRSEIERVGIAGLDGAGITRRFVAKGASRARVQAWITEAKREAAAGPSATDRASVAAATAVEEAEIREATMDQAAARAAMLDRLPPRAELDAIEDSISATSMLPASTEAILDRLQRTMDTCSLVLAHAHTPEGKLRNPRMALQAADTLRRCLETALKLYDKLDAIRIVERFMKEMLDEIRPLSPETAKAIVHRLQKVQRRWAERD